MDTILTRKQNPNGSIANSTNLSVAVLLLKCIGAFVIKINGVLRDEHNPGIDYKRMQ